MTDKTYPYDERLPFVLVNRQTGEMMGRAVRKATAENFAAGLIVDVIDTTPKPRVPEDATWIIWDGGGYSPRVARRVGHALMPWVDVETGSQSALGSLPGVTPDTVFTVLEERKSDA